MTILTREPLLPAAVKPAPFDPAALVSDEAQREGLRPRPTQIGDAAHRRIVERVVEMYRACKRDQPAAPPPYQPGGEWADYLAERQGVYDAMLAGDLDLVELKLRGFWRNELGPIVKEYARYEQLAAGEEPFASRFAHNVCRNYLIWRELYPGGVDRLRVPAVGDPWGYVIDGELVAPKATRFHVLATQSREMVRGMDRPLVAEIGAGYGGMALYLLRDESAITYVDFDLPETLALAAYYLLASLPERRVVLYGETAIDASLWAEPGAVLLPNFALPCLADLSVDLFINTFSLSELGWTTLEVYLAEIQRATRGYFLHHNMDRAGVINRGFERIPASRYPIDAARMRLLHKGFDLFHGHGGDYREFLYQRLPEAR